MPEWIKIFGDIQNNGGILALLFYVVIELRYLRRDSDEHNSRLVFLERRKP